MQSSGPSILSRLLAIVVLVVIAIVAIRVAVGLVVGFVSAILWVVVLGALVVGGLWARSTLKSARRERALKRAPAEDPVQAEMRRITEQLREQGRG